MKKQKGLLIVISGPSGAGKGTICQELLKRNDNLFLSISMTTREPRGTEVNGVEYYFVSEELIQENAPQVVACGVIFVCNQSLFSKNGTTKSIHS